MLGIPISPKAKGDKNEALDSFPSLFTLHSARILVIYALSTINIIVFAPQYCSHFNKYATSYELPSRRPLLLHPFPPQSVDQKSTMESTGKRAFPTRTGSYNFELC